MIRPAPQPPLFASPAAAFLARIGLLALLLPASGCRFDDYVRSDRQMLLWLVVPLLLFGVAGTILVYYGRRGQLAAWDLRQSPEPPSERPIVLAVLGIAGSLWLMFTAYNLFFVSFIKVQQQWSNIGLWIAGSLTGAAVALLGGLRWAEPGRMAEPRGGRS
jgi:hypothetical protein